MLTFVGLDEDSKVEVFDTEGQKVAEVERGRTSWDGNNDAGDTIAAGVYILKMTTGDDQTFFSKVAVVGR